METIDIGYSSLLIGFILLLIPFYFLWKYQTGIVRSTVVAVLRMTVQLFFIGFYLKYLFVWNSAWINLLWMLAMVLIAAQTLLTRSTLRWQLLLFPAVVSLLVSVLLVGTYFLGVVLQLEAIFDARYFIPIFGILMGNILSANVIGLNTYFNGLQREHQLYYYLLGNGASLDEARAPFVRQALIKAFNPVIANMAVMGLVALPGTMIGQILGGSTPDVAIRYQIMIMIITFSASILSLIITIKLSSRKAFDAYGRLLPLGRIEKLK